MEDTLRNLRLRRFTYEMTPRQGEERTESTPAAGHAPDDELPVDRGDKEPGESAPAADGSEPAETIADAVVEMEDPESPLGVSFPRQDWSNDAAVEVEEPESQPGVPFQRQDWSNDAAVEAEEPESPLATESADYVPAELPADEEAFPPTDEDSAGLAAPVTEADDFVPAELSEVSSEVSSPNESPIAFAAESPAPEDFSAGVIPSGDDEAEDFSVNPAEAARARQTKVANEAAQQTGLLLEQVANAAIEQIRHLLGQIATSAIQQSNRAMVRMAEDAADQTGRVLERLVAEATSQVHQILKKIGDEQVTPPLSASVEGLGDEVRRVGRELFKSARAADHNKDLFDKAITELQRLTSRIEQVPSQLYGAESITEVKAAICREMIGVADAMEASLATAEEILSQFQEPAEPDEAEEETEAVSSLLDEGAVVEEPVVEEPVVERAAEEGTPGDSAGAVPAGDSAGAVPAGDSIGVTATEDLTDAPILTGDSNPAVVAEEPIPFWRPGSWPDKLRNWLWRVVPPPAPPPSAESARIAELEEKLDQSLGAMNQWLDGQQLLYERLQTALRAVGVRQIETEGQMFDPALHRAVSTEARTDVPAGTVIGEERKGYTLDGKILRYAEVIVAKNE
ncbi:MAG: nucleotide exchange factor GrpE [Blastocatellia bacterium]